MEMRFAKIPFVLITGYREEPIVILFDEGTTEAEICAMLSEDWQIDQCRTIDQLNETIDQFEFKLDRAEIKVKR